MSPLTWPTVGPVAIPHRRSVLLSVKPVIGPLSRVAAKVALAIREIGTRAQVAHAHVLTCDLCPQPARSFLRAEFGLTFRRTDVYRDFCSATASIYGPFLRPNPASREIATAWARLTASRACP